MFGCTRPDIGFLCRSSAKKNHQSSEESVQKPCRSHLSGWTMIFFPTLLGLLLKIWKINLFTLVLPNAVEFFVLLVQSCAPSATVHKGHLTSENFAFLGLQGKGDGGLPGCSFLQEHEERQQEQRSKRCPVVVWGFVASSLPLRLWEEFSVVDKFTGLAQILNLNGAFNSGPAFCFTFPFTRPFASDLPLCASVKASPASKPVGTETLNPTESFVIAGAINLIVWTCSHSTFLHTLRPSHENAEICRKRKPACSLQVDHVNGRRSSRADCGARKSFVVAVCQDCGEKGQRERRVVSPCCSSRELSDHEDQSTFLPLRDLASTDMPLVRNNHSWLTMGATSSACSCCIQLTRLCAHAALRALPVRFRARRARGAARGGGIRAEPTEAAEPRGRAGAPPS